jgi:hypothetical protein
MVVRLLGEVQGFPFEGESLGEACLAEGVEDSVDRGAVAHLRAHLAVDLFWGKGGRGLF